MKTKFQGESGAIIDSAGNILHLLAGNPGEVDFPWETIWEIHQRSPGLLYAASHVHPPGMTGLSSQDQATLKAWAWALHPFPARLITIAQVIPSESNAIYVLETCYLGILEAKSSWLKRSKDNVTPRKFEIYTENQGGRTWFSGDAPDGWYGTLLMNLSYGK